MRKVIVVSILVALCGTFASPVSLAQSQKNSAYQAGRQAAAEDFRTKKEELEVPREESQLGIWFGGARTSSPKKRAFKMGLKYNILGFSLCNKASQDVKIDIPDRRMAKLMDKSEEYRQKYFKGYKEKYRNLIVKLCQRGAWIGTGVTVFSLGILLLLQVAK